MTEGEVLCKTGIEDLDGFLVSILNKLGISA